MSTPPINEKPVSERLGASKEYAKALLETKVDQIKLEVVEKGTKTVSALFIFLFAGLGVCGFLFFGFFALAIYLGQLLNSSVLGFLVVAGFVLLLTALFYAFRHPLITTPIFRRLAQNIYESSPNNHE